MTSSRYFVVILLLSVVLLGLQWAVFNFVLETAIHPIYYSFYLFFAALSIGMHTFLMKALERAPQKFVAAFTGGLSIKMLVSLIFLMITAFQLKEMAKPLVITFLVLYFSFSGLEIATLFKASKKQSNT